MPKASKKRCRHKWEYSENCWKRNICTKCGQFQREPLKKPKQRKVKKHIHCWHGPLKSKPRCLCGHNMFSHRLNYLLNYDECFATNCNCIKYRQNRNP